MNWVFKAKGHHLFSQPSAVLRSPDRSGISPGRDVRPLLSIIVPVYNDEKRIAGNMETLVRVLDRKGSSWEIILVDDGSGDQTWEEIQRCIESLGEAMVGIRLNPNQGKGAAVAAGMKEATGEYLFFMDADLPYDLEVIWMSARRLQDEEVGAVVGDRELAQSETKVDYSWRRVWTKKAFSWLTRKLVIQDFPDTQCGFKGFRYQTAQELFTNLRVKGFSFDVELLVMAVENGIRVERMPVRFLRHQGSSLNLVGDSLRMGSDLLRIAWRRRRGHYRWAR